MNLLKLDLTMEEYIFDIINNGFSPFFGSDNYFEMKANDIEKSI